MPLMYTYVCVCVSYNHAVQLTLYNAELKLTSIGSGSTLYIYTISYKHFRVSLVTRKEEDKTMFKIKIITLIR